LNTGSSQCFLFLFWLVSLFFSKVVSLIPFFLSFRYYYGGDILAKVPGKHYSYKFICDLSAAGYTVAELSSNGNFGHENHAVNLGSVSPVPTYSPSQPSSPSVRGSIGDSDGSIDVPLRPRKSTKSQRVGSLASALESIRRRHDRSASQVAA
jgi:hypothetical protein